MEQLLIALAEAIKAGSELAYPALMGYYTVKIVEALIFPICWSIIGYTIYKIIVKVNQAFIDADERDKKNG